MTTPPNHDASSENVTDFADFKARFDASLAGSGSPDHSALAFVDAPLKPLPLLTPPETPVLFRLRVDLADSHPPIWRRLTLPSNLTLDVLHDVLQTAFGWTNSHLHRFALATDRHSHETQGILTPYDVEEGDEGVLESELRLDQLLAKKNDWLHYTYDFGDDWDHTIKLEDFLPQQALTDAAVRCVDGRRRGPVEDVGGIYGWEHLLAVAAGTTPPDYPEQREIAFEMGLHRFVDEIDLAEINRGLERLAGSDAALGWLRRHNSSGGTPSKLDILFAGVSPDAQRHLAGYLASADVVEPTPIDEAEAATATAVIRTFLGNVGGGIRLTSAGYLPPARVRALMEELDTEKIWRGEANRESQTYPLLFLRETAAQLGLVRKFRGDLLLTKRGAQLRDAPVELWQYLAARLPLERSDDGRDSALLLLMLVAAGEAGSWDRLRESLDLLTSMVGWTFGGRGRYGNDSALSDASDTRRVLGWAGTGSLLPPRGSVSHGLETDAARQLARAALTRWT
ncbi:plasmid pRiA4b ORF-3 family protein [Cryobacterium sp. Hh11]|uniref:plasmid pRiA4b ORF-3 family protein n=1 Tax=Cryobacterium sp. Hh11 TaxID=2555868 RepID=UPI00106B674F|nr:plasmid pRiA4b ORF-3 family protein [Cryobacterium sp. Hh11]TFD50136.1 plasmid pRiA4b ORF-3 family protein [Cryobacterium sp. Hh11]